LGCAEEITLIRVDFPALGRPTMPTSARSLSSIFRVSVSPGSPGWANRGVRFVDDLNRVFPWPPLPPFAIIKGSPALTKSFIRSPVSALKTRVPRGISILRSSPFLPFFCLPCQLLFVSKLIQGAFS